MDINISIILGTQAQDVTVSPPSHECQQGDADRSSGEEEEDQYVDDVEVVADGEVEAAVVEVREDLSNENMVITSSCTDYDEEHGLVSLNEETTCF